MFFFLSGEGGVILDALIEIPKLAVSVYFTRNVKLERNSIRTIDIHSLDAYSINQLLGKQWKINPALLLGKCTDFLNKGQ